MATHAMIDIETLGTGPNCVVLTVGAVKFNPWNSVEPHSGFLERLDVDQQDHMGRKIDELTLQWWAKQDEHIRQEALGDEGRIALVDFCKKLNKWLVGCDKIWCQGPQFDMVILEHLFEQFAVHKNWAYWQICDSRTIFNLMPGDPRKNLDGEQADHHSALADAYVQAVAVQKSFKHFGVLQQ